MTHGHSLPLMCGCYMGSLARSSGCVAFGPAKMDGWTKSWRRGQLTFMRDDGLVAGRTAQQTGGGGEDGTREIDHASGAVPQERLLPSCLSFRSFYAKVMHEQRRHHIKATSHRQHQVLQPFELNFAATSSAASIGLPPPSSPGAKTGRASAAEVAGGARSTTTSLRSSMPASSPNRSGVLLATTAGSNSTSTNESGQSWLMMSSLWLLPGLELVPTGSS